MVARKPLFGSLLLAWLLSLASLAPAQAQTTLWNFLGIPQGINKVAGATINRRGNFPGLERKPPLKSIADPANLESSNPAIKTAAQIKQQEDLKKQKIKALKYLAKIGCGCYPGVKEALMQALDDCTEEVRYAAAKQIGKAACNKCEHCNKNCCCDEEMTKKLAEVAYEKDDCGCWLEPSARVREAAREAMQACCCANPDRGGETIAPGIPVEGGETVPPPAGGETVPPSPGQTPADLPPSPPSNDAAMLFEVSPSVLRQQPSLPAAPETIKSGENELVFEPAPPRASAKRTAAAKRPAKSPSTQEMKSAPQHVATTNAPSAPRVSNHVIRQHAQTGPATAKEASAPTASSRRTAAQRKTVPVSAAKPASRKPSDERRAALDLSNASMALVSDAPQKAAEKTATPVAAPKAAEATPNVSLDVTAATTTVTETLPTADVTPRTTSLTFVTEKPASSGTNEPPASETIEVPAASSRRTATGSAAPATSAKPSRSKRTVDNSSQRRAKELAQRAAASRDVWAMFKPTEEPAANIEPTPVRKPLKTAKKPAPTSAPVTNSTAPIRLKLGAAQPTSPSDVSHADHSAAPAASQQAETQVVFRLTVPTGNANSAAQR